MICSLALVLLMDVSASILPAHWVAQRNHTASALASDDVVRAIEREPPIAVTVMGFDSGVRPVLGWRVLHNRQDAVALAQELRDVARPGFGATDIAAAIHASLQALQEAPCEHDRAVIDLSTDGEAEPITTAAARDVAQLQGVTINAIGTDGEAEEFLRQHAITADGFLLVGSWDDYPALMRRKLIMELAGVAP
jgi:hypothetical protein